MLLFIRKKSIWRKLKNNIGAASLMEMMVGVALVGTVIAASTAVSKIASSQVSALISRDSIDQASDLIRSRLQFADSCTDSFGRGRLNVNPLLPAGGVDQISVLLPEIGNPSVLTERGSTINPDIPELGLRIASLQLRDPAPIGQYARADGTIVQEYIGHLYVTFQKMASAGGLGSQGVAGGSTFTPKYLGSIVVGADDTTGAIESCRGTVAESFEDVCKKWNCTFVKGASPECQCDYGLYTGCTQGSNAVPVGMNAQGLLNCVPFGGECPPDAMGRPQYVQAAGPNYVECAPVPIGPNWDIGAWTGCPVTPPPPPPPPPAPPPPGPFPSGFCPQGFFGIPGAESGDGIGFQVVATTSCSYLCVTVSCIPSEPTPGWASLPNCDASVTCAGNSGFRCKSTSGGFCSPPGPLGPVDPTATTSRSHHVCVCP